MPCKLPSDSKNNNTKPTIILRRHEIACLSSVIYRAVEGIKHRCIDFLCAPADCFTCLWSPCCPSPVHAEEEPHVQPAEGGHCVVHGELQHLRQWQVSGCQGSAQGLGDGRLRSEYRGASQLSGTNYRYNDGSWRSQLIEIGARLGWLHSCLSTHHVITVKIWPYHFNILAFGITYFMTDWLNFL